eukprot:CAMPEP_0174384044 /NCGR_PEP_ID=MMETSP0811_2-20130205/125654_1 /TAXON_ID=73025 ORGANISM="Eutreptiella gymnastica-like, Strain CCMP1594" /NCGR_SAMPLE_ID=MMETSP0811_2 /ASSEMBLY_ACC=CAM_ASM_000667 /LENGTH=90 /DNA_ID=CAMNT_0015537863 /DNA_START=737 /DNA_END=1009 /DNA_ORIENTATION=+
MERAVDRNQPTFSFDLWQNACLPCITRASGDQVKRGGAHATVSLKDIAHIPLAMSGSSKRRGVPGVGTVRHFGTPMGSSISNANLGEIKT